MNGNTIRFNQMAQQTVGDTTKILGLVKIREVVDIIGDFDCAAITKKNNPLAKSLNSAKGL